jgi:hypothetical protein
VDHSRQAEWKQTTEGLPEGCAAALHAIVAGQTLAGIFRLMSGETHMLCYHVMGDVKPTVERLPSIQAAQERANVVLSTRVCMPR